MEAGRDLNPVYSEIRQSDKVYNAGNFARMMRSLALDTYATLVPFNNKSTVSAHQLNLEKYS